MFYLKDGTQIEDILEWANRHADQAYREIDYTLLPDGKVVTTFWDGIDRGFGLQPAPLIFESRVQPGPTPALALEARRYSTEAAAREGHMELVKKWMPVRH